MSTLPALAKRCEKAAGPDRTLDRAIQCRDGHEKAQKPPAYTASLDAAMTLVPEEVDWRISRLIYRRGAGAVLWVPPTVRGDAATPALALCAAALRAHAAIAIEAQRAVTTQIGTVEDESADPQGIARKGSS